MEAVYSKARRRDKTHLVRHPEISSKCWVILWVGVGATGSVFLATQGAVWVGTVSISIARSTPLQPKAYTAVQNGDVNILEFSTIAVNIVINLST